MKMEDAKIGDFVRHKEGGSEMKIVDLEVNLVVCEWPVGYNQVKTWGFPPDELDLVREGK